MGTRMCERVARPNAMLFALDHFVVGDSVIAEVSKYYLGPDVC